MISAELIKRTTTGILIVVITVGAIVLSPYTYILWLSLIAGMCAFEFICPQTKRGSVIMSVFFGLMVFSTGYCLIWDLNILPFLPFIALLLPCILFAYLFFEKEPTSGFKLGLSSFAAYAYIVLPLLAGCLFILSGYDYKYVLVIVILLWVNDVFAYLTGRKWGRHKLMPLVSPGKSIEGTFGGLICTLVVSVFFLFIWPDLSKYYVLIMGLFTPLLALAGDLWESSFKRFLGIKDSGTILPGHGGLLDRYDSLLFVLPAAAFVYCIFVI